ncbi:response regulator transcription factor [Aliarcobacter cibarius]|jgi:two-component system, OmpR family, response regulator|uniref:Response regulator transcription factor n=1 Tax=Aliarcobacter cibarius TaxID=255507 RepID=A0A5J6REK7_9BACT|nr:response regulator transcription factor [Aliarcobacter cibarius]QEZ88659.1 two-component system response regulator [Aliarcobacter cibarius]QKJ26698.1 two-component system response regulator [Aliarcobacter cibarius]TLS98276.1 response regulator transcription factor [Aliarcobacter cibarius]TLS98883.1 response regulator transcription factor [Aliarcobacter cibarius]TLT03184.1 response regulator transcription factor [Aliarcobacter cibarius]
MKILIIEDDIQLNTTITNFLKYKGHETTSVEDGEDALEYIDKNFYNLFIIDINIPKISGLEILKYIRQRDLKTPVIIITASLELENLKVAYKDGCDEYIKKPFYLEELEIKIDKICQSYNNQKIIIISENISYDTSSEELFIDGEVKRLRKKEKRLLSILLENVNKTVSTQTLENYVWENEIKESYPLRQLVNGLRKYFENGEKFIFSDAGIGYRFETKKI